MNHMDPLIWNPVLVESEIILGNFANRGLFDDVLLIAYVQANTDLHEKYLSLQFQTRILVTNSVAFLPKVDFIVVLNDGKISEQGTYKELLSRPGPFTDFIAAYLLTTNPETEEEEGRESR